MMSSRTEVLQTAGAVQNPLFLTSTPLPADPPAWTFYHKPIIIMVIGGLVLSTGAVLYLLNAYQVTDVPHAMGPGCLSFGFMFIVVALVWLPIIKDRVRQRGLKISDRSHAARDRD